MQIVFDEINKDFIEKFVMFAYEDICKDTFASVRRKGKIAFAPSLIGSYWLNDYDGDTGIFKAYPGYDVVYSLFSKSGFTQRMLDIAKENNDIFLINEEYLV